MFGCLWPNLRKDDTITLIFKIINLSIFIQDGICDNGDPVGELTVWKLSVTINMWGKNR